MAVGSDTDLSASGGSLQPASPRCRSVPARLRKSCSVAGAARDFLGWGIREVGFRAKGSSSRRAPPTRPAPSRLRAGEDVPRSVEVGEAGAAAAGQRGEELRKEGVGYTGQRTEPFPPALPSGLSSSFRPGHQPYRSSPH